MAPKLCSNRRRRVLSPKLPADLEEEILSRVPANSLARFRCVCRQWNALFDDGRFVKKHLAFAPDPEFILWNASSWGHYMGVSLKTCRNCEAKPSFKLHELGQRTQISKIIPCDGLLLCVTSNNTVNTLMVWNPCLNQVRLIYRFVHRACFSDSYIAFGYDKKASNGYKIVMFWGYKADIYSFATGKWRDLRVASDPWPGKTVWPNVSLNGNSYWIARGKEDSEPCITSFDFSTEKFKPLSGLPLKYHKLNPLALSVFRGDRLSVLQQCYRTKTIEICVTKKGIGDGVSVSWSKFMTVELPDLPRIESNYACDPSFYIDNNNNLVLCSCVEGDSVGIYVVREDNFKKVQLHSKIDRWPRFHSYVPSLVPISASKKQ